jgi:hypothetical protein
MRLSIGLFKQGALMSLQLNSLDALDVVELGENCLKVIKTIIYSARSNKFTNRVKYYLAIHFSNGMEY